MRVCYFGTYRQTYARNRILIDGLRANEVEVTECHVPLWTGIEDRVDKARGGWLHPRFVARVLRTYWGLLRAYRRVNSYDVLMLGYPGYFDTFVARPLTWLARKPLVLDTLMSIYLVADERGLVSQHPFTGRLIRWAENLACRLPDLLILDTPQYVDYFHHLHGVEKARFRLVPLGADDRVYRPVEVHRADDGVFRLVYYGTFIPNHGTLTIIEAAHLLRDEPRYQFVLIGRGPDQPPAMEMVQTLGLPNVSFVDWVDKTELPDLVASADVCLGVFGNTPQSRMTVHNKIKEAMAMGKPVISGDSAAVRGELMHGEHIWLCERENPQALATAIQTLADDPGLRQRLSAGGRAYYEQTYTLQATGRRLKTHLEWLLQVS